LYLEDFKKGFKYAKQFVFIPHYFYLKFLLQDGEHEDILWPGSGGWAGVRVPLGVQLLPHSHLGQPLLPPPTHQAGSQVGHTLPLFGIISAQVLAALKEDQVGIFRHTVYLKYRFT